VSVPSVHPLAGGGPFLSRALRMFIYVDESGAFAHPIGGGHSYGCAGALTIPGRSHGQIIEEFDKLKCLWGYTTQEVKGNKLKETEVASIVDVLYAGKARLHVAVTDMAYNTPNVIAERKREQADRLMAHITSKHTPEVIEWVRTLQNKMRSLPDQLFVQMLVMIEVVDMQLQDAIVHYALFDPPEIGEFHWVVDRKGTSLTVYEDLFHTLAAPFIQARQFSIAVSDRIRVGAGDYTHFDRFCRRIDKWPEHLPPRQTVNEDKPIDIIDIGKILQDSFRLGDSATCPGLQLADVVTNVFRRAICGRLQYDGWKDLGRLMVRRGNSAARLVNFGGHDVPMIASEEQFAARAIMEMTRVARSPLTD